MFLNQKIQRTWPNILWQPLLASVYVAAVLITFILIRADTILWAIGSGALASSAYNVFGMPSKQASQIKNILGGYLIAATVSSLCHVVAEYSHITLSITTGAGNLAVSLIVFALVVGAVLVLMAIFSCEHPPAAGLALVLAIDMKQFSLLLVVLALVLILCAIRYLLASRLKDLSL